MDNDAKDAARYRFLRRSNPDNGQPYVTVHKVSDWGKWFNTVEQDKQLDDLVDREMVKASRHAKTAENK